MKHTILLWLLFTCLSPCLQAQVPANDVCAGAIVLPCNGSISGTTANATNDVIPPSFCEGTAPANGVYKGVWYRITPTQNRTITVNSCTSPGFDTYLRVYTGTCSSFTSCVGFDDDGCGLASSVTFDGLAGINYYILLGGYGPSHYGTYTISATCAGCVAPAVVSATDLTMNAAVINWGGPGSFLLEYGPPGFNPGTGGTAGSGGTVRSSVSSPYSLTGLAASTPYDVYIRKNCTASGLGYSPNTPVVNFTTSGPPPVNDTCINGYEVRSFPMAANNLGATQSMAAETCSGFTSSVAKDVWYFFTAPASGQVSIRVSNLSTNFDAVIQAYFGDCGGSLSSMDCIDTAGYGGTETLALSGLNAGSRYNLRVYGYSGSVGNFDIAVCTGEMSIVPNAIEFCNQDTITIVGEVMGATYEWFRNGVVIPGVTSNQLKATQAGIYKARVAGSSCTLNSNEIELFAAIESALIGGTGVYADGFFPVNIGITNYVDVQTYLWKKAGAIVYGPPYGGNGGNQSYQFQMSSPAAAGQYIVEALRPGCPVEYSNPVSVYFGGVRNLVIDSVRFNKVGMSWQDFNNPIQYFEYYVSTSSDPYLGGISQYTKENFVVVDGLSPSTQYYLHIRGGSINYIASDPLYYDFSYGGDWTTLDFTTGLAPVSDECSDALQIGITPLTVTTNGATQSLPPAVCSGNSSSTANDIWFKFTATSNTATIKITDPAPGFNAVIQLFGGACNSLAHQACRDAAASGQPESLSVNYLSIGNTYFVRIYGRSGSAGSFGISVCQNATITASALNFCESPSITLSSGLPGFHTWFRNGSIVSGSSAYQTNQNGNYTVEVSQAENNCVVNSNTVIINSPTPVVAPQYNFGPGVYAPGDLVDIQVASTVGGQTYMLKKVGSSGSSGGPMNGNGGNQSFLLAMASSLAGDYFVETFLASGGSCVSTSSFIDVGYGGVSDLQVGNCPYNSVDFSWTNFNNAVQRFRYIVSEQPTPTGDQDTTELNQITVNNLLPGRQYYIHVSGATIPGNDLNNIVYSNTWVTIPFRTASIPVSATSCEWTGTVNTDWDNAANWRCGFKPTPASAVWLPVAAPRYPVVSVNTTIKSLTVITGASVTVTPGVQFNISN